MTEGTITFDLGEHSWTSYALFDRQGRVKVISEEEALELAKLYPQVRDAMGISHQEGEGCSKA